MQPTSDREQTFLTMQRLWAMAMSGQYSSWGEVERALAKAGSEVRADRFTQALVDSVCGEAVAAANELSALDWATPADDAHLIWRTIEAQHIAYWMRDLATFASLHVPEPHFRFFAWVQSGGVTARVGWDEFIESFRGELEHFSTVNPYLARRTRRLSETLRIAGDMAWAAFDLIYPVADFAGFNGLGRTHEVRILERHEGQWRICFQSTLDDQFGQTDTPTWQVDADGRVLVANLAARQSDSDASLVRIRNGRLEVDGAENRRRLSAAIRAAAEVGHGIFSRYRARPMVLQPVDGSPSRVLWVVNQGSKVRVSLNDEDEFRTRLETATNAFGLSPAQCRLVASIVGGKSLTSAAEREGIAITTARTQMNRAFEKIGVNTLSGLITALIVAIEHAPMD